MEAASQQVQVWPNMATLHANWAVGRQAARSVHQKEDLQIYLDIKAYTLSRSAFELCDMCRQGQLAR